MRPPRSHAILATRTRIDRGAGGGVGAYAENPTTFTLPMTSSGQANLSQTVTLNDVSVTPNFLYTADLATAASLVAAVGQDLPAASTGTEVSLDQGSPWSAGGGPDTSFKFEGGKVWQSADTVPGQIGTDDIAMRIIFKHVGGGAANFLGATRAGTTGWQLWGTSSGQLNFLVNDGGAVQIIGTGLAAGAWYDAWIFINRDEASTDGGKVYINGIFAGQANFAAVSGDADGDKLAVGASASLTNKGDQCLAYFGLWTQAAWHQAGAAGPAEWAAYALAQHDLLTGFVPSLAKGTSIPKNTARASAAMLDITDGTDRKMYYVGSGSRRVCDREDSAATRIKGYLIELSAENKALRSQELDNAAWTEVANTTNADSGASPDGGTLLDAVVTADAATDTQHGWQQAITVTAVQWQISCWAKAGAQNFLYLADDTVANAWAYFNLSTGAVGNKGAGAGASGIEDWGSGLYRCFFNFTGTAAAHTFSIYASDADDNAADPAFVGDGASDEIYAGFVQVELGAYPTSYVPTEGAAVSRLADVLQYTGDDGNLGGVGSELQGSVEFDFLLPDYDVPAGGGSLFEVSDGAGGADRIFLSLEGDDRPYMNIRVGGVSQGAPRVTQDVADGVKHTAKMFWQEDNFYPTIDDVKDQDDTSATMPDDLDTISVGYGTGANTQRGPLIANVVIKKRAV